VIFGRPPIFDMNCDWSITDRLENILSFVKKKIYPVRKPWHSCLSADRYAKDGGNTCKSRSISSLFLPTGRQGGQGQSSALSNGVKF